MVLTCSTTPRLDHRAKYDLTFWIDCSFSTALKRALARGQENLTSAETIHAYETTFFPAQRIHFARDNPRVHADYIINNDPGIPETAHGVLTDYFVDSQDHPTRKALDHVINHFRQLQMPTTKPQVA